MTQTQTQTRALIQLSAMYAVLATEENLADFQTALDDLTAKIADHAEGIAMALRLLEAASEAVTREVDRLTALRDWHERRAKELRSALLLAMQRAGLPRIDGALVQVRIGTNPPAVKVLNGLILPPEYTRTIPPRAEPDKAALLAAWKAGATLPDGVTVTQGAHLVVK